MDLGGLGHLWAIYNARAVLNGLEDHIDHVHVGMDDLWVAGSEEIVGGSEAVVVGVDDDKYFLHRVEHDPLEGA